MYNRIIFEDVEVHVDYPDGFKAPEHIEVQTFNKRDKHSMSANTEIFFEGVKISVSQSSAERNMRFYNEQDYPAVTMLFLISGMSRVYPVGICAGEKHPSFQPSQHNIGYAPTFASWYEIEHTQQPFHFIDIQLTREYFEKLAREDANGFSSIMNAIDTDGSSYLSDVHLPLTPPMLRILNDITHCQRTGYMKKVLMESRVVELLTLQSQQAHQVQQQMPSLKHRDIEKLYAAKHHIESNPMMPPSLVELARSVGLNDFKLKKGFRELFNTTVFGYANDLRMDIAKRMLLDEQKNISDVADALGYSQPHHFATAFKKKFGVTPSGIRK